jgi:pyruvate/2-oxoglutarate dehydrogenase complex dihydrolipoamide dehydrogenase (E3) component
MVRCGGLFTNANVFDLTELPRCLLVVGGGPLGCEMAFRHFAVLAHKTTIVQHWLIVPAGEERDRSAAPVPYCLNVTVLKQGLNTEVSVRVS